MATLEVPEASSPGEIQVYESNVLYLDGKVYTGTECQLIGGVTACQSMPGEDGSGPWPYVAWYIITGDHYWPVVALESAIMLAGSAALGAFALFWVGRRRPY
jgi:hypothetical protein